MAEPISRLIVPGIAPILGRLNWYMSAELENSCVLFAVLGDTIPNSCINRAFAYPDLIPTQPAPDVTASVFGATTTDGSKYFYTSMMPSTGITIGAISKRISGIAPILATAASSVIGQYGFNLFWNNSTTLQFNRIENNSGAVASRNVTLTVANANVWHRVIANAGAAGSAQQLRCPTNGATLGTATVVYPPDTGAPGPAYIGADRITSSTGAQGMHAVVIGFNANLSDAGRAELDNLLVLIASDLGITFGT